MKKIRGLIRDSLNKYILDDIQDTLAMQILYPYSRQYLPWSTSSIRPTALVKVLNEIILNNKRAIVECGGGISTYYIAMALSERNSGHLYTIENDVRWVPVIETFLRKENLQDCVTIITAPLTECKFSLNGENWYDTQVIERELQSIKIDMLLVDGPPAYKPELRYARYSAVAFFKNRLASDYTIILDDINRQGEQKILSLWETMLDINFTQYKHKGGIAIGRPTGKFTV